MAQSIIISAARAFDIASQWGSYMRDGDPGAVFYTFPAGDAIVQSEDHRKELIAYTNACLAEADGKDRDELTDLLAYFQHTKADDEKVFWCSSSGTIEIAMTRGQARAVHHTGACDADVDALAKVPEIASQLAEVDPAELRKELKEYGTWVDAELCDHAQNLQRILWIAAGDINDGSFDTEED